MGFRVRNTRAVRSVLTLVLSLWAGLASSADLPRSYFARTTPGSWARYEQTTVDQTGKTSVTVVTLARLADEGARSWLEVWIEPAGGERMTLKYLLRPGFDLRTNPLVYAGAVERAIMQEPGKDALEVPWQEMKGVSSALLGGLVDYGRPATPKGAETVGRRRCDRFGLAGDFSVKVMFVEVKGTFEAELWLSGAVPFGRVKEISTTKDDKGNVVSRGEMKLVATGHGAKSRITGEVRPFQ